MGRRSPVFFYMPMILAVCFVTYGILEIAVRSLRFPDPRVSDDMELELASVDGVKNSFNVKAPIYGWDQEMISGFPMDRNASKHSVLNNAA
jgi:hypothetical protein